MVMPKGQRSYQCQEYYVYCSLKNLFVGSVSVHSICLRLKIDDNSLTHKLMIQVTKMCFIYFSEKMKDGYQFVIILDMYKVFC